MTINITKKGSAGIILAFISLLVFGTNFAFAQGELTSQERSFAAEYLAATEAGVIATVKNLSNKQVNFKPSPDVWSVAEGIKHLAASENELWALVEATIKQPGNPDKRSAIKTSDQDLIKAIEDRTNKSKTFAAFEPANSPYKTTDEALAAFKEKRQNLITYVKNTKDDLRNHVAELPLGTHDAYQLILLISAHTKRHIKQMEEVLGARD